MPPKPSNFPDRLEVAVTHTREAFGRDLVRRFFESRWIMTGTAGFGPECDANPPARERECRWWNRLREHGGAVIANYEGCLGKGQRVIGWVEKGQAWEQVPQKAGEPLYGLHLTNARIIDRHAAGFANLKSGRRSLGACHEQAIGKLWTAVQP